MNDNVRRNVLPTIRTAFLTQADHSAAISVVEYNLLYDMVGFLRDTPYEYMLYMAIIESLDGLERRDQDYAESVERFYEEVM